MTISQHVREYQKQWRLNNAAKMRDYQREYRKQNKGRLQEYNRTKRDSVANYETHGRKHHLRRKYGITVSEYNRLLALQEGKCAICKTDCPGKGKRHFHVDHDHLSGKVRGLLCVKCNMGLGSFDDNQALLWAAAFYVNENRADCDPEDYQS